MNTRRSMVVALAVLVTGVSSLLAQPSRQVTPPGKPRGEAAFAPGRFIVTLRDGVDPRAVAREHGVGPDFVYTHVMRGFGGSMSEAARSGLLRDNRVVRIERDAVMVAQQTSTGSWGLDRIDQRSLPLNGTTTRTYSGRGVTIYIVDSGIRFDHVEFGGRASSGYDAFGGNASDCNGHGTHVAGIAAGATYGVANEASIVSVKVLDCEGSGLSTGVIAGLDWILANRRSPAVVNMSLGGPAVQAIDDAVNRLTNAGVIVVVAAGNDSTDACTGSPSRTPSALTVGASDRYDVRGSFSNYGSCVDLFAPGVLIPGPYVSAATDLVLMSGTSSASPFVAGTAALVLQHYPSISGAAVSDSIKSHATRGVVTNSLSANNHLLYSLEAPGGATSAPPPTNTVPVAGFAVDCTALGCVFSDRSYDPDGSIVAWSWAFGTGATSILSNPTYTFPAAGSYPVTLRVTDNAGATATTGVVVTVTAPATQVNVPPVASFTSSCSGLGCAFTDRSTDADGTITSWYWTFGNGASSSLRNPTYTYPTGGSYTVTLRVTDNAGASSTIASVVTPTAPSSPPPPTGTITISARGTRQAKQLTVDITWSGATTTSVDLYRNGTRFTTTANDGAYRDVVTIKGGGTIQYRVCLPGTSTCSATASVTY